MNPVSAGSELDVEALVRRHQEELWRYCRFLGASAFEAEEVAQDVFLVLLRKGHDARDERATGVWLRRTARYLFLDRRRRAGGETVDPDWVDAVDGHWEEEADANRRERFLDALAECVDQLRGRSREVVELFYRRQLSRTDVAGATGLAENGVKTLLQRTRQVLRRCVEREVAR